MTKKTYALLCLLFAFALSWFLAHTFQHPVYISKRVLLFAALAGFGAALAFFAVFSKRLKPPSRTSLKKNALLAFILCLLFLLLFGYTPATLFTPRVSVQLAFTTTAPSTLPLTSLTAISDGSLTFPLSPPTLTSSPEAAYQQGKLVIHAGASQPAAISFTGRTWSNRIRFYFEESKNDFVIDFYVNGAKSTYAYTAGQESAFLTSVVIPPNILSHTLSFIAYFLSLFVSVFFLAVHSALAEKIQTNFFEPALPAEGSAPFQPLGTPIDNKRVFLYALILFVWLAVVIFTAAHHEFWRDEVRALTQVRLSGSLAELYELTQYDGHPVLWFLFLSAGRLFTNSQLILPIISILVAFFAVALFLFYSPFPLWFKCLFIFSGFPLYEYSVMARSYGLTMLFLFISAWLYKTKKEHPLRLAFALFLLANTHVLAAILVIPIVFMWICDFYLEQRSNLRAYRQLVLPLVIILAGFLLSLFWSFPRENTIFTSLPKQSPTEMIFALQSGLKTALLDPGRFFVRLMPFALPALVISALLYLTLIGLLGKPALFLAGFGSLLAFGAFFGIAYRGTYRHQGIFLVFLLVLYWLFLEAGRKDNPSSGNRLLFNLGFYGGLLALVLGNVILGYQAIRQDLDRQMSSSKAFGAFITGSAVYQNAVIVPEPDYMMEPLPYYAPQAVLYYPREGRFGEMVNWTTEAREHLSLGELLAAAKEIKKTEHKPVLIALGHFFDIQNEREGTEWYSFNKLFTWNNAEWQEFFKETSLVATFNAAISDENYLVFELKDSSSPAD